MGYTVGVTGLAAFSALAFIPLEHGAYPTEETTYPAVSYVFGNVAAASDFHETVVTLLLFVSILHATRHKNIIFLWFIAGAMQALGIGMLPLYLSSIADYRMENFIEMLTLGTGAFPVAISVGITATILTIDWVRQRESRENEFTDFSNLTNKNQYYRGMHSMGDHFRQQDHTWWFLLSRAAGYTVTLVGITLAFMWLVPLVTLPSSGLTQRVGQTLVILFLSLFVFDLVRVESMWTLIFVGGFSIAIGFLDLRYGNRTASLGLSAGTLLIISGVSLLIARR